MSRVRIHPHVDEVERRRFRVSSHAGQPQSLLLLALTPINHYRFAVTFVWRVGC